MRAARSCVVISKSPSSGSWIATFSNDSGTDVLIPYYNYPRLQLGIHHTSFPEIITLNWRNCMASEGFHESSQDLKPQTRDMHRAIVKIGRASCRERVEV